MPLRYYRPEDHEDIARARDFSSLLLVARRVLERKPQDALMVCGPITTGGFGNVADNKALFERCIEILVAEQSALGENGWPIFNQWPFEASMSHIIRSRPPEAYCHDVLEIFYRPIFESRRIGKALFLPGWQSSTGASWEWQVLQGLSVPCEPYPWPLYQEASRSLGLDPLPVGA